MLAQLEAGIGAVDIGDHGFDAFGFEPALGDLRFVLESEFCNGFQHGDILL